MTAEPDEETQAQRNAREVRATLGSLYGDLVSSRVKPIDSETMRRNLYAKIDAGTKKSKHNRGHHRKRNLKHVKPSDASRKPFSYLMPLIDEFREPHILGLRGHF